MKIINTIFLIVSAGVIIALSVCSPSILTDNEFLKGFVTHEILGMLGVIMTISITTIATIHIWFNELEAKHGKRVFSGARREINQSALVFIGLFVTQLFVLIFKSLHIFTVNPTAQSLFVGVSILLLLASVMTLIDIMNVVKALTPKDDV